MQRWSGVALVEGRTLGATAAMLGDWDLQSTLLRRTLQAGARLMPVAPNASRCWPTIPAISRSSSDPCSPARAVRGPIWASRYVLPLVEDFATEKLMESRIAPSGCSMRRSR